MKTHIHSFDILVRAADDLESILETLQDKLGRNTPWMGCLSNSGLYAHTVTLLGAFTHALFSLFPWNPGVFFLLGVVLWAGKKKKFTQSQTKTNGLKVLE